VASAGLIVDRDTWSTEANHVSVSMKKLMIVSVHFRDNFVRVEGRTLIPEGATRTVNIYSD
jgi:hypothetical protein